jgi:hypothetical protein
MLRTNYQQHNTVSTTDTSLFDPREARVALKQRRNVGSFRLATAITPLVAYHQNIDRFLHDIRALSAEEDSDGYIFRPSPFAFAKVWELVSNAYIELDVADRLPRPFVSPDGRAGIRVEWTSGDRVVSLLRPGVPERQGYIYYAAGEEHGANREVTVDSLTTSLRWLLNRD